MQNTQTPDAVRQLLGAQQKNQFSAARLKKTKPLFPNGVPKSKQTELRKKSSEGGKNGSRRAKKLAGKKGGLTRRYNAFKKLGMLNHPTALSLLKQIQALD